MPEADFDAAITKMEKIAVVVAKFDNPDVQALAYATLAAQAFGTPLPSREPAVQGTEPAPPADVVDLDAGDEDSSSPGAKKTAKKAAKRAPARRAAKKTNYVVPKDVNYAPAGQVSLHDYVAEKQPKSKPERALVAVYYLEKVLGRKVNTGEVIAVFRVMGWEDPSNPDNNLQQAGIKHWLDTSNMSDIKLAWGGERYLNNELPKQPKKKA